MPATEMAAMETVAAELEAFSGTFLADRKLVPKRLVSKAEMPRL
ncbi:MAG: hypothetical protein QOI77_1704 [Blastocatellia bacterium]|jgi:hypothetical protein|nr:hypothetical protein [Blastocatellia bacterium]